MRRQPDILSIVAICFFAFMILNVLKDRGVELAFPAQPAESSVDFQDQPTEAMNTNGQSKALLENKAAAPEAPAAISSYDPEAIAPPYDQYTLTQGPHGQTYGHLAIDITNGKGAALISPINGVVTALFTDDLGNTTLVIENEVYQVMMLHGLYTVSVGEQVALGQPIGKESNQGNTVDALGRSCRGRDCGYHTHLNIFNKRLGVNVNPLELFQ